MAVVDSQLIAASLPASAHPHASQAPPACPEIDRIDVPSTSNSFAMCLDSGGGAVVGHAGQHLHGALRAPTAPWPSSPLGKEPSHPPRIPLGMDACGNVFKATEAGGGVHGPAVAVPEEAAQLPEYLASTLSALQSFMVGLEASSDAPVCLHCPLRAQCTCLQCVCGWLLLLF